MPDPNTIVPTDDSPGRPNLMRDLLAAQAQSDRTALVCAMIENERARQVHREGWTPEHDDAHTGGELGDAAACYALHPNSPIRLAALMHGDPPRPWPWAAEWWKPGVKEGAIETCDRVRELVKAGALIVAEIERLQRAAAK